jgi:hypothetical protein
MELQLFVSSSSQSASEEINQTGSAEIGPHVSHVVAVVVVYKKNTACPCIACACKILSITTVRIARMYELLANGEADTLIRNTRNHCLASDLAFAWLYE